MGLGCTPARLSLTSLSVLRGRSARYDDRHLLPLDRALHAPRRTAGAEAASRRPQVDQRLVVRGPGQAGGKFLAEDPCSRGPVAGGGVGHFGL